MAKKNKNKNRKKDDENKNHHKPYQGPFQSNPYEKIDSVKRVMQLTNQTPTKEVISSISETDDPFTDEEELSKQISEERKSPTDRKNLVLKIGYYFILLLAGAGIIAAIGFFFDHSLRINYNEKEIQKTQTEIKEEINPDLKEKGNEIQNMKSDNRLIEYRLQQIENEKNVSP